jgi:hypothetical protein
MSAELQVVNGHVTDIDRIAATVRRRTAHVRAASHRAEAVAEWVAVMDRGGVELTDREEEALSAFAIVTALSAERQAAVASAVAAFLTRRNKFRPV